MTNEERSSVIGEQMAERKMGQEERQLQLAEDRLAQEAGLGERRAAIEEERIGKIAPYEIQQKHEKELAQIRADASAAGLKYLGGVISGDQVIPMVMDNNGNVMPIPGTGGTRWKDTKESIPNIPENTRQNLMQALFEQIRQQAPNEAAWIPGIRGKLDIEDLNKIVDDPNYNGEGLEGVDPIVLDAYRVLRKRLDIGARADGADPKVKERVIKALTGIGMAESETNTNTDKNINWVE